MQSAMGTSRDSYALEMHSWNYMMQKNVDKIDMKAGIRVRKRENFQFLSVVSSNQISENLIFLHANHDPMPLAVAFS